MADAQLSVDHHTRAVLLQTDDEFRQMVSEHHALDEKIRDLSNTSYLTHQQQFEESALKKRKLVLKDRIETKVREHLRTGSRSE